MKKILPVLLTLCLGAAPVFSQNVQAPAASAVTETGTAGAAQAEAEIPGTSMPTPEGTDMSVSATAAEDEAALFGSDVPQLSMVRAIAAMGLVLCLLVGAYLGIRKFAPGYFPKASSGGKNLKIVESLGMGDRRSIALVEVGGRRFLIGSTPQQINLLTVLPEHFSLVAEDNEVIGTAGVKEEGERQVFRNMFDMGRKNSARNTGNVLSEEVRQKMRRLREALENR